MENKTAVNWLISVLAHNDILDHKALSSNERLYNLYKRLKEQAEAKEKQQIIDAATWGALTESGERYYIDKYGSKGSDGNFKQFSLYEHKETITSADTITSSQTEISDEEIEREAELSFGGNDRNKSVWVNACKWYREQLKSKQ